MFRQQCRFSFDYIWQIVIQLFIDPVSLPDLYLGMFLQIFVLCCVIHLIKHYVSHPLLKTMLLFFINKCSFSPDIYRAIYIVIASSQTQTFLSGLIFLMSTLMLI